jgi:hypothetical protein
LNNKKGNKDNNKNNWDKNASPMRRRMNRNYFVVCSAQRKVLLLWKARAKVTKVP